MPLNANRLRSAFDVGTSYEEFVASGESEGHRPKWDERYEQLALDDDQQRLVSSFTREMQVLTLTGTWCGDCALQGAALARITEANPLLHLRFVPRTDDFAELIVKNRINGGFRVPVTWFLAEDFEPVSRIGDRPLSRYRAMARKQLPEGAVTICAEAPADPVREVLTELLDEFERVQLLLRLSGRLRERHGD